MKKWPKKANGNKKWKNSKLHEYRDDSNYPCNAHNWEFLSDAGQP